MNSTWFARGGGSILHIEPANIIEAMADGTEQDGIVIDRGGLDRNYLSAKLVVVFHSADLADSENAVFTANIRSADDSGMTTNVEDVPAGPDTNAQADQTSTFTAPASGEPHTATVIRAFDFDISGCRQFIQAQVTVDVDDATPATGNIAAVLIFVGADGEEDFAADVPTVTA